ncbi:MAG: AtpZ/AtpI family protein [Planctomycetia bacterium]|nr:AtpZ/AtpI family protein [Planctomycetia bacterium]
MPEFHTEQNRRDQDEPVTSQFVQTPQKRDFEPSSLAIAYAWVTRITGFSLEFAALVVFGFWVDKQWHCKPWGIILGALIGVYAFIAGLFATVKRLEEQEVRERLYHATQKKSREKR